MTYCKSCATNFATQPAFDAHRIGRFAVTAAGRTTRRCMAREELAAAEGPDGPLFDLSAPVVRLRKA